VSRVVERVVDTTTPLAWLSSRVRVVAAVPSELPRVLADERRFEQILGNLLQNGVRHTETGGIVAVTVTPEEKASVRGRTQMLRIDVRDTGEGIAAGDLPHIWDRFYRGKTLKPVTAPRLVSVWHW